MDHASESVTSPSNKDSGALGMWSRLRRGARALVTSLPGIAGLLLLTTGLVTNYEASVPLTPFDTPGWFEVRETNGFLRLGTGPVGNELVAFDDDHLCSVGKRGIWWSDSGGRTWHRGTANQDLTTAKALTSASGWAWLAVSEEVWCSKDRGQSWQLMGQLPQDQGNKDPRLTGPISLIRFFNHSLGFTVAGSQPFASRDGGRSWATVNMPLEVFVKDIEFDGATNVHMLGASLLNRATTNRLAHFVSRDGGETWAPASRVDSGPLDPIDWNGLSDLAFGPGGIACAVGHIGVWMRPAANAPWQEVPQSPAHGALQATAITANGDIVVSGSSALGVQKAGSTEWQYIRVPGHRASLSAGETRIWWTGQGPSNSTTLVWNDGVWRQQSGADAIRSIHRTSRDQGVAATGLGCLSTTDGGRTWLAAPTPRWIEDVRQRGTQLWAAGFDMLRRPPGGEWELVVDSQIPRAGLSGYPTAAPLQSLRFWPDGRAIMAGPVLLQYDPQLTEPLSRLTWHSDQDPSARVRLFPPEHGVAVGRASATTTDRGQSWLNTSSRFEEAVRLTTGQWIAIRGTSVHTGSLADGQWRDVLPTKMTRPSMSFVDDREGWVVGASNSDGLPLVHTQDGGQSWQASNIPGAFATRPNLAFLDSNNGWVTAFPGGILRTEDNGQTWVAPEYSMQSPVAVLWLMLASALGLGWALWHGSRRSNAASADAQGALTAVGVSDAAVTRPEQDLLDRSRLAKSLSLFLRNRGTSPPLTLAITGSWGTGKSSVMHLLEHDLRKARFNPIWFNAWHHETESEFYGALLEAIRRQGMPPWFSASGLVARMRLLYLRMQRLLLGTIAVAGAVLLLLQATYGLPRLCAEAQTAWHAAQQPPPIVTPEDFVSILTATPSTQRAAEEAVLRSVAGEHFLGKESFASRLIEANEHKDSENVARQLADRIHAMPPKTEPNGNAWQEFARWFSRLVHSQPGTFGAGGIGLLLLALLPLLRSVTTFGSGAGRWVGWLSRRLRTVALHSDPGIRHQLTRSLDEVCTALQTRPLVVFVDDLDRCSPERQLQMLEILNFLSTGRRRGFFVLGAALDVVIPSIATQIAPAVKERTERLLVESPEAFEEKLRVARLAHARMYLEKMIAVEVHVDAGPQPGLERLMEEEPARPPSPSKEPVLSRLQRPLDRMLLPVLFLMGMSLLAYDVITGPQSSSVKPANTVSTSPAAPGSAATAAATAPNPSATNPSNAATNGSTADTPMESPVPDELLAQGRLLAAPHLLSELWILFAALVASCVGMVLWLFNKLEVKDTPVFRKSLVAWARVLGTHTTTPRHIKRIANQLRLLSVRARLRGHDDERVSVEFVVLRALREFLKGHHWAEDALDRAGELFRGDLHGMSNAKIEQHVAFWLRGSQIEDPKLTTLLAEALIKHRDEGLPHPDLSQTTRDLYANLTRGIVLR